MTDIIICSLPSLILNRPPAAPAMLKSAVLSAGFSCNTLELSQSFYIEQCNKNIDAYELHSSVFRTGEIASEESVMLAQQWIKNSIAKISKFNPKFIGLSVFTVQQHRACYYLARAIRQHFPDIRIILGGFGVNINCNSLLNNFETQISKKNFIKDFGNFMIDDGLADHVVRGEGEALLVDILKNSTCNKVLESIPEKGFYKSIIPDYDDYNLDDYIYNDEKSLPITGSRGCVRDCTFCDVPGLFGRFRFRNGEDIAHEMIFLKEKYGVKFFDFTDSLVNGNLKTFQEWLRVLADYNDQVATDQKIKWCGQYICRPQSQTPEDIYPLIARAGGVGLTIGVESASDEILESMRKKMKIQDVYDELDQFKKYRITTCILMMSGFYNETWERYLETLKFIIRIRPYLANGVIVKFSVGTPLYINEQMYLGKNAEELGIMIDPEHTQFWTMKDDPENTFLTRAKRRLITQIVSDKLGLQMNGISILNMKHLPFSLRSYEQKFRKLDS